MSLSGWYGITQNPGFIVTHNNSSNKISFFKDFEVSQVATKEVCYPIRVILKSSEECTMVMPNRDLTMNVTVGKNSNCITSYNHFDIASVHRSDFCVDTQYHQEVEALRDFIEEYKPKNGTLQICQELS